MKSALLIIDAQQDLMEGSDVEQGVYKKDEIINNINTVVERAVNENVSIVFIRDLDVSSGEGAGFQVHQNIIVPANAVYFDKTATNSFYGTPLKEYLAGNNVEHIVIMGCKTENCIDTAVRTATINGFDVTLVGDGHSTSNSENLTAGQIIQHHNETLNGHYNVDNFSMVRSTDEDLFKPEHYKYR